MPIAKKKKAFTPATTSSTKKSNLPTYAPKDLGMTNETCDRLFELTIKAKEATSATKAEAGEGGAKKELFDAIREKIFAGGNKSAYIEGFAPGKRLVVKTNTRLFPLSEHEAELISDVIESGGLHDAGDYYFESQQIGIGADKAYERLGEVNYDKFVEDFRKLLTKHKIADLVEFNSKIMPKADWPDKRLGLPPHVNMAIEGIKATSMSCEAKVVL